MNEVNQHQKNSLVIGDVFPTVTVETTQGLMSLPDAFQGKWWVFFSHPADFTPVCTTELVAFQKRMKEFKALKCELIGLSIDQVFSHIKWLQWIEETLKTSVEFPIIADTNGLVAETLGLIHVTQSLNTVRAVFVVNPRGIVRAVTYYPPEVGRNVDEIVRVVKALRIADEKQVAMPAGWPENELIGANVITPPARDVKTAQKRMGGKDCYDWWFCHSKLK